MNDQDANDASQRSHDPDSLLSSHDPDQEGRAGRAGVGPAGSGPTGVGPAGSSPTGVGPAGSGPTSEATRDWRELLAARRFTAAKQAYVIARGLGQASLGGAAVVGGTLPAADDNEAGPALNALADVEDLVRERSYLKAKVRIERLESRPLLAPWQRLLDDLDVLAATSKALDRREPDAALEGLEALADSWFEADVMTQRGTAQIYLGELDEARASFERALAIDPQHYRALTNLGNVALEQGEVDEAIEYYLQALKLNEEFANAHHNLGVAYRRKGQVGKSVRSLRRAQRVSQRSETAQARESFTRWTGKGGQKYLRWIMYAAIGGVLWWLLRSQGII